MFDSGASNKVSDFDPVSRLETTKVGVSSTSSNEELLPPPVRIKNDVTDETFKGGLCNCLGSRGVLSLSYYLSDCVTLLLTDT